VSAPLFAQPERRSFLVPVLLALAAIAVAVGLARHFFPATTVNIVHIHTAVLPTETVFSGSTIVGQHQVERVLFVASKIRIDNQLRQPIYLDGFHITFTNAQGAEETESAFRENELAPAIANYAGLQPLVTQPLLINTVINPNSTAEGTLLFSLRIPKDMWDARQSAIIKVDLYHRPALYLTIPR
jgi:hypothetical protein